MMTTRRNEISRLYISLPLTLPLQTQRRVPRHAVQFTRDVNVARGYILFLIRHGARFARHFPQPGFANAQMQFCASDVDVTRFHN